MNDDISVTDRIYASVKHREDLRVDDDSYAFRVAWRAIGTGPAHLYPASRVDERSHLCQGLRIDSLDEPCGEMPPLRTPRDRRTLYRLEHARDAPGAYGCVAVLCWMFGDDIGTRVIEDYRAAERSRLIASR